MSYLFTSESVSRGHPDKVADQISDAILDYFLEQDNQSRVAVETFCTPNKIIIGGEIRSNFTPDYQDIENKIRELIKNIGYTRGTFSYNHITIEFLLNKQSPDIAVGVDQGNRLSEGAGDQGIMFGYACDQTPDLMPAPILYAHRILSNIYKEQDSGKIFGFGPDAKSQVTVMYDDSGRYIREIDTILVSIQHSEDMCLQDVVNQVKPIVLHTIPENLITNNTKFLFNPTGRFVIGGPEGDTGLTGRKIIVDTYGGSAPHGGGAFSGKDPTKVDRSGAYIARYLAKNIVASGLVNECLLQLSYAIGIPEPISIYVKTDINSKVDKDRIIEWIKDNIDLTPTGIRNRLNLNAPIYLSTASYGHFGKKYDAIKKQFSWENIDIAEKIASYL